MKRIILISVFSIFASYSAPKQTISLIEEESLVKDLDASVLDGFYNNDTTAIGYKEFKDYLYH